MSLLRDNFQGNMTFSVWNDEKPAQSPDLPPLVFLLWEELKERGYQDNSQTVTEFKEAIDKEIKCIGSEVTKVVINSMKKRAQNCIQLGNFFKHIRSQNFELLHSVLGSVFI